MKNIKKYIIWFIIWISCVNAYSFASNWTIWDLFNFVWWKWSLKTDTITSFQIKDGSINTNDLKDWVITSWKLWLNSVDSFRIINNSILEVDLADWIVSTDKLKTDSVNSSKIIDWTITELDLDSSLIEKINSQPDSLVMCQNNFWVRWIKWTYQKNNSEVSGDYLMRYQTSGTIKIMVNSTCWQWNVSDSTFQNCIWWTTIWCWNPSAVPKNINYDWKVWKLESGGTDLEWCWKWGSDGSWWKYVAVSSTDYLYDKECDTL